MQHKNRSPEIIRAASAWECQINHPSSRLSVLKKLQQMMNLSSLDSTPLLQLSEVPIPPLRVRQNRWMKIKVPQMVNDWQIPQRLKARILECRRDPNWQVLSDKEELTLQQMS